MIIASLGLRSPGPDFATIFACRRPDLTNLQNCQGQTQSTLYFLTRLNDQPRSDEAEASGHLQLQHTRHTIFFHACLVGTCQFFVPHFPLRVETISKSLSARHVECPTLW